MTMMCGGPMFDPKQDEFRKSCFGKDGGHYNIYGTLTPDAALGFLRQWFPDGKANEMNLVLFSTSGVHGMYTTIEEVEEDIKKFGPEPPKEDPDDLDAPYHPREVTFLVVQPRIVGMTYGNVACRTLDDVRFLKTLRSSSWSAARTIGKPEDKPKEAPRPRENDHNSITYEQSWKRKCGLLKD